MDCNAEYDYDCCEDGRCTRETEAERLRRLDGRGELPSQSDDEYYDGPDSLDDLPPPPQVIVLPGVSAWAALYQRRPALHALMLRAIEIMLAKSHDYAGADCEPLANFRECERIGVCAWKGVLVRMGDKWRRLTNFARIGLLEVEDENFVDTLLDLANYALICAELCQEITEPD